jgi:hypothetical protein
LLAHDVGRQEHTSNPFRRNYLTQGTLLKRR